MEHFIVSARKYRPQNFEDVVGQKAITNTLENAIKNNHLAQALLFTGPRGVGKTSCARILAKRINQEDTTTNDDEDFSFNIFELDAASNNSVDDIRNLTDQVRIPPQTGNYKVYIIDEVHMLSQAAFNAFLKTLEEPPKHAIFILATTEKHKIIPTILSRCQIFDFKRITVFDAKEYLKTICEKENITADDDALHIIAQKADGAMRDALSIFDRVVSFSGNHVTREAVTQNLNVLDYEVYFTMTDLLLNNKIPEVLISFNEVLSKGFEGHHFINGLASHFRDLLVAKDSSTVALLEVGDNAKKKYLEQSQKADLQFLISAIDKANNCDLKYKSSKNQRLLVELTLMQIASITFDGAKKKSDNFIIPATFFTSISPKKKETKAVKTVSSEKKNESVTVKEQEKKETPKLSIDQSTRKRSAFSLKNVHERKEIKIDTQKEENFDNHPKEKFTLEELTEGIKKYYFKLTERKENNLASVINSANIGLNPNSEIELTVVSELIKKQILSNKPQLLKHLREHLNNYQISIEIVVNKSIEKKYAYTNQEKYEKMLQKNPLLNKLKTTFGLDV